jgi:hypothetical protein
MALSCEMLRRYKARFFGEHIHAFTQRSDFLWNPAFMLQLSKDWYKGTREYYQCQVNGLVEWVSPPITPAIGRAIHPLLQRQGLSSPFDVTGAKLVASSQRPQSLPSL